MKTKKIKTKNKNIQIKWIKDYFKLEIKMKI